MSKLNIECAYPIDLRGKKTSQRMAEKFCPRYIAGICKECQAKEIKRRIVKIMTTKLVPAN